MHAVQGGVHHHLQPRHRPLHLAARHLNTARGSRVTCATCLLTSVAVTRLTASTCPALVATKPSWMKSLVSHHSRQLGSPYCWARSCSGPGLYSRVIACTLYTYTCTVPVHQAHHLLAPAQPGARHPGQHCNMGFTLLSHHQSYCLLTAYSLNC